MIRLEERVMKNTCARSGPGLLALLLVAFAVQGGAAELKSDAWTKIGEGHGKHSAGAVLVWAPDLNKMLLAGSGVGAFDPAAMTWSEFSAAKPPARRGISPYYQGAYSPETKTIYCLSGGSTLYSFECNEKKWTKHKPAPELGGLSWHVMVYDPVGKRLVVVGSDKRVENLGWTRTMLYDVKAGKWSTLPAPDGKVAEEHKALVEATERTIDLVGRIRLAWYRDPEGVGTEAELKALVERCGKLKALAGMTSFKADVDVVTAMIKGKKTLDALKAARAMQRKIEDRSFEQYPVPRSRRNSPIVYDAGSKRFMLFGGDHEDYLLNDTWVLDLEKKSWKRAAPKLAPSPRAGQALCYLPKSGRIAMYGGYRQASGTGYGAGSYYALNPHQLWTYDLKSNKWELLGAWTAKRGGTPLPGAGFFYGYAAQCFNPAAMLADANDNLFIAQPGSRRSKSITWGLRVDVAKADAAGAGKHGGAPNVRLYRKGYYLAAFGEVDTVPKPTNVDKLPANKWVRLPDPPRNFCRGRRQRDWSTIVWDSDRDQILTWGGGHCVQCCSPVAHYSPASGRMVEGYDADEPYGRNGGGGFDSSVMNRPWISVHNYNHYAYDPVAKLLVTTRGYLYDPDRMDWIRMTPMKRPFTFRWGNTLAETTPYGVVAWARKAGGGGFGLWLFDGKTKTWTDLKPTGKLRGLYCDSEGACYDSKRDRFLMGFGGGYGKKGDGRITFFDFKTKVVDDLRPENKQLGVMHNTREMVYIPEADIVLFGSDPYRVGGGRKGRTLTRVYDCEKNKYMLLDAGSVGYGHSTGWMYDAKRKNVYVSNYRGQVWALHIDAKSLKLLDKAPGS
jgi:Galactose oxidase, central domain